MFAGHLPELVILLVVALVIFGPKRLPEIGGAMGKGIREFRRGTAADEDDEQTAARPVREPAQIPNSRVADAPVDEPTASVSRDREVS